MTDYDKEIEIAKERLKKALPKIKKNVEKNRTIDEPDLLVSGTLDEVGIKRESKHDKN